MKFYQVVANFDSSDSNYFITIGNFSSPEMAILSKEKWENFFLNHKPESPEPKDWDPKSDSWYKEGVDLDWFESEKSYNLSLIRDRMSQFTEIRISEMHLDKDVFTENAKWFSELVIPLMIQYDRDYKLNDLQL